MQVIFYTVKSRRSLRIYEAWRTGLAKFGLNLPLKAEWERRGIEADVSIHYGLWGSLRGFAAECAATAGAKAVFCDLGFWGRLDGGKVEGYHRLAVNGHHATPYFQRVQHGPERFNRFGIETQPFRRSGEHVLLAGMSQKAAWVYGLGAEEWERRAAAELAVATPRAVHYRPKQSWKEATPIAGTVWRGDEMKKPIEGLLDGAWALATHHGNTALDALIAGIPVFCEAGLGSVLAERDLSKIEAPRYPDEGARDQLLWDAACTQFKPDEIAEGTAWRYLNEEGLV